MRYQFLNLELCPQSRELRRDGKLLPVRPKALDLLLHLILHRERVVAKRELLDQVWVGEQVDEDSLSQCLLQLRRAFRQRRGDRGAIETHYGHGYRFVAQLVERADESTSPAQPTSALRIVSLASDAFVGRENELAGLTRSLAGVTSDRGSCVFITGAAGMGSTALARALVGRAAEQGIPTLWGRCQPEVSSPAYWPWCQMLRAWVESLPVGQAADRLGARAPQLAKLVPVLGEGASAVPVDPDASAEHSRGQLFEALSEALEQAAGGKALVLIVDDLQWADPPSLAFLAYLAGQLRRRHLLVIGTLRAGESSLPLASALAECDRQGVSQSISLIGLERDEVADLIRDAGCLEPHPRLVDAIHQHTGGNPYEVTEVVGLLSTDARLEVSPESPSWELGAPPDVKDVIVERVARLGQSGREALRLASVLGLSFDLAAVRGIADDAALPVLTALEDASDAGLVRDRGVDGYVFSHSLIRETLYASLEHERRQALHLRLGERMIDLETQEGSSEIAGHLLAAFPLGDVDRTIEYAVRAGDEARARHGPEQAVIFYQAGLSAIENAYSLDDDRRPELRELLVARLEVARSDAAMPRLLDAQQYEHDGGELEAGRNEIDDLTRERDREQSAEQRPDRPDELLGGVGDGDAQREVIARSELEHEILGRHLEAAHSGANPDEDEHEGGQRRGGHQREHRRDPE
ncbi:MAG: AAA family ATPase [Deltaproteobacteria bacterium]|nr:AAA family ATPase [Deltaproteobacteria bacterium]MBW2698541.1 AAA family ATPase [Deltaproteobacteria bacterium]